VVGTRVDYRGEWECWQLNRICSRRFSLEEWHRRPARESRARCACRNQGQNDLFEWRWGDVILRITRPMLKLLSASMPQISFNQIVRPECRHAGDFTHSQSKIAQTHAATTK